MDAYSLVVTVVALVCVVAIVAISKRVRLRAGLRLETDNTTRDRTTD